MHQILIEEMISMKSMICRKFYIFAIFSLFFLLFSCSSEYSEHYFAQREYNSDASVGFGDFTNS